MEIESFQLRQMLRDAVEHGITAYRVEIGLEKPYLSLRGANKIYGKANVDKWIKNGIVHPNKDGLKNCKIRISRIELDLVSKTSNSICDGPTNNQTRG
jgi:hypothetical protein